jgi:hypothetical protein
MTRFEYSIDGFGKAPELYENAWIPFTIHSPILLYLNLLKAAIARCQPWLPETNFEKAFLYFAPPTEPCNQAAVIRLQLRAVSMLKAHLKSPVYSVDDESIAAACYMIYLEVNCYSTDSLTLQLTKMKVDMERRQSRVYRPHASCERYA